MSLPMITEMYWEICKQRKDIADKGNKSEYWEDRKGIIEVWTKLRQIHLDALEFSKDSNPYYEEDKKAFEDTERNI